MIVFTRVELSLPVEIATLEELGLVVVKLWILISLASLKPGAGDAKDYHAT